MSFEPSPRGADLRQRLSEFLETRVVPAEAVYEEQMRASGDPHHHPAVIEELKTAARTAGCGTCSCPM